jgi:hypothetical protein
LPDSLDCGVNHKNSFATRPKNRQKCQWSMLGY